MSNWVSPIVAAKIAVEAPMNATMPSAHGANSKSGEKRATRNTPAVTMVAAWISAETGVGPSMASGSQVCRPSCADLPMAPMNSSTPISSSVGKSWPNACSVVLANSGTCWKMVSYWTLSKTRKQAATPSTRPKSPTRLTMNAFIAAAQADGFCTRSRSAGRRRRPTPSQPKNSCSRLSEVTSISIAKVNSDRYAMKRGTLLSWDM